jgi:hypothetical protein
VHLARRNVGRVVVVGLIVGVSATTAVTALAGSAGQLKAFQRPARAGDAVPRWALQPLATRYGSVVASRRIAVISSNLRGRAELYLVKLKRGFCLSQLDRSGGAGGGCSPSGQFLSSPRDVSAGGGNGFLHGVAGNEIVRVAFVDRHWRLRPVRLTHDNGFLYVCRNRNGCVDVIKAVNGYDGNGRRVWHEVWSR